MHFVLLKYQTRTKNW